MNSGIYLLAAAGFSVLTSEFLIVGLLPEIAADLEVSIAMAGALVTLFSVMIVLTGPFMTAAVSGLNRRWLLVGLMAIFTLSNCLSAVAPDYLTMAISRIIPAMALAVFWGVASSAAIDLAGSEGKGRAIAIVSMGAALASVFGMPLGVLIGDAFGWRAGFAGLAALCLLKTLLLIALPTITSDTKQPTFRSQLALLRDPQLIGHVVLSALVFGSMFSAYTYLADILGSLAGLTGDWIGWAMMAFGAVGVFGNNLGGKAVDAMPTGSTSIFAIVLAVGAMLTVGLASSAPALALGLALWGTAQAALGVVCSVRLINAAPGAAAFAYVMGANIGIALGAFAGGQVIEAFGLAGLGWTAASFALASAALATLIGKKPANVLAESNA